MSIVEREPEEPTRARRPLGYMETRMHLMHELLRGSTQGVVALRVRGPLDAERFVSAVRQTAAAHDLLRCTIVPGPDRFEFELQEGVEVPLRVLVRESDEHWSAIMRSEVESPIDASRSLFRVTLLAGAQNATSESDIVLAVHHAIMDGAAVDHFFDQVLKAATEIEAPRMGPRPLPPPAEQIVPKRMRVSWEEFCRTQRAAAEKNTAEKLLHADAAPLELRRTQTAFVAVEATALADLERCCHARNLTFNSLASAALISAVHRASPGRRRIALNTTFSLRRLCAGLTSEDLGCYMSIVPTLHAFDESERPLDVIAAEHQSSLAAAILQKARCPLDVPLDQLRDLTSSLRDAREFVQDIGITYGESTLDATYGPLSIVQMYATVNRSAGTLSAVVHGVKIAGKAFFTVNHTSPLQSADWAERVVREFTLELSSFPAGQAA